MTIIMNPEQIKKNIMSTSGKQATYCRGNYPQLRSIEAALFSL